jgi:hypothetical protein
MHCLPVGYGLLQTPRSGACQRLRLAGVQPHDASNRTERRRPGPGRCLLDMLAVVRPVRRVIPRCTELWPVLLRHAWRPDGLAVDLPALKGDSVALPIPCSSQGAAGRVAWRLVARVSFRFVFMFTYYT